MGQHLFNDQIHCKVPMILTGTSSRKVHGLLAFKCVIKNLSSLAFQGIVHPKM